MKEKIILTLLLAWVISIALAIFIFSSHTGEESGDISGGLTEAIAAFFGADEEAAQGLHTFVRKSAHMAEYAMLGMALCSLLFYSADKGYIRMRARRQPAALALSGAFLYAVTDEIHQYFVPGRGPAVKDVLIDTAGAAIGIALIWCAARWLLKKRQG